MQLNEYIYSYKDKTVRPCQMSDIETSAASYYMNDKMKVDSFEKVEY